MEELSKQLNNKEIGQYDLLVQGMDVRINVTGSIILRILEDYHQKNQEFISTELQQMQEYLTKHS